VGAPGAHGEELRGYGWWPLTATGPARCWRKRGVRATAFEAEWTVARALLASLPLACAIITGDALSCQRTLYQQIVDAGGHYVVLVKANQPDPRADRALSSVEDPRTL